MREETTKKKNKKKPQKTKFSEKEITDAKLSYYFDGALRLHLQILSHKF